MKTKLLLILLVVTLSASCAFAAKAKAKPKPKAKPKAAVTTHHETMGTEQLKGEYGEIGHTYTLGRSSAWNMRLSSAEYTVDTVKMGDRIYVPTAQQKLLVLHYTVHNPQKSEAMMRFDTLPVTAVDSKDQNYEYAGDIAADDGTNSNVNQEMKPAQKKDVFTVIAVPAEGEIPKIIFKGSDDLVIRYDLRGKVKPLAAQYADPKDPKGCTALATVPAEFGKVYPLGQCALSVNEINYQTTAIGDDQPPAGGKFLVATCTAKNLDTSDVTFRFDTFTFKVADPDGIPIDAYGNMIRASSFVGIDTSLKPGQEMKFRTYVPIDKAITPKTLTVREAEGGREFQYQIQ